ncbi:hypothetical protein JL108_07750 [Aeromicrobium sp. YIM 150415]|uniref:hypothetical protein n=1 Tax=Aeromicrobium sp. YIM 150415 TaxID=2803912 RepID=UPI0019632A55|nr:hypothetical protein [Aeromicrobium sp. YIM 150415]MBM9463339.1 hypothetical protein [Aeromicrobium sp. YIM 150415]
MSQHRRTTTADRLRRRFGRFGVLGMIIALVALTLTPPATAAQAPPAGSYTGTSDAYSTATVEFEIDANGNMSGFDTESYCFDGLYQWPVQWAGMPSTPVNAGEPFDLSWEFGDGSVRAYYELTGTVNADGSASGTGRAGFLPYGTCGGIEFEWTAQGPDGGGGDPDPIEPTISIQPSSVTESQLVSEGVQITGGDFIADSSVTLTVAGSQVGSKDADADGAVSFGYNGPLAPGSYPVELSSADGSVDSTLTVTADPEPEPEPSVGVSPGSVTVSQLASDGVMFSGEDFGANAQVAITADGSAVETVAANGEGAFSYTYKGQHQPGTLTLTASSAAGQDSATVTVTADPDPEPEPSVGVSPGSVTVSQLASDGVVFSGEDFGANADVTITNGQGDEIVVLADDQGAFSYRYTGDHQPGTLTLTASSAAGQDSATVTVTADAPVYDPAVSLDPTSVTQSALAGDGVTVSGTGFPENADVEVRFDGSAVATVGSDANGTVSYELVREGVAPGTYPVALVSGDWSDQANLTVTADPDPEPEPSVGVSPGSVTVSQLASDGVVFSGEDFGANAQIAITADGSAVETVAANGEGAFSYTYKGQHQPGTLTLAASSAAGQDSATVTVTEDPAVRDPKVTVTPQTLTQSQARDTGVTVASTGWFEGDVVVFSVGGEEAARVTADEQGNATAQLTSDNASIGQHTVTAAVGDASAEATFTVTADPDPNATIPAEPPSEDNLTDDNRGGVTGPDTAVEGSTIELVVPGAEPGSRVGVWAFSEPTYLGAFEVSENRTIQVTLPDGLVGDHRLAVYADAEEEILLGWTSITITQADDGGGDDGDNGGGGGDEGRDRDRDRDGGDRLPNTGANVAGGVAGWALLLLLGGGFLIARSRTQGGALR